MNKKTEKFLMMGTVALLLLGVIIAIVINNIANTYPEDYVAADSVLASGEEGVFYNNLENDILRKDIYSGEITVFAEDLTLLSASNREVLATDGNNFIIMNNNGEIVDEIEGIVVLAAQITDDYIYYKHIDSRFVVELNRATGDVKDLLPIAVDKFEVHGTKVVFTTDDNKMVYFYDTETEMPMGYFGDKLIADFEVYNDFLIYSDLNEDGKVVEMNLSNGSEEEISGIRTAKFVYNSGKAYYLENAKKNKKAYELMDQTGN